MVILRYGASMWPSFHTAWTLAWPSTYISLGLSEDSRGRNDRTFTALCRTPPHLQT